MAANSSQPLILDDRFEIKARLPDRHFCKVYSAFDRHNDVEKLLLLVPREIENDADARDILKQSTRNLLWLTHPGIARFFGMYHGSSVTMIETELLRGENLKIIKHNSLNQKLPENKVVILALKILEGLEHAHNQNILHKSLTPSSIFLTRDYKVKILDFSYGEALYTALSMIRDITFRHPILYMSPEQVQGRSLSVRSDIYSFGAVLYELLAGQPPFLSGDVYHQILHERPAEILGISSTMNQILQASLSKDMSGRYSSCAELMRDLAGLVKPKTNAEARPPEPVRESIVEPAKVDKEIQAAKKKRNWKPWKKYLSISLPVLIILFTSALWMLNQDRAPVNAKNEVTKIVTVYARDGTNIKDLADQLFQSRQWFEPQDSCAHFYFNEILKINPNELHAKAAIDSMREGTIKIAVDLFNEGRYEEAGRWLSNAFQSFGEDQIFSRMCSDQLSFLIKIDILNGTVKNGIASETKDRLAKMGYKIRVTDNLQISGKRKRDLAQSCVVHRQGLELPATFLANHFGIKTVRSLSAENISDSSGFAILLGNDFPQLTIAL